MKSRFALIPVALISALSLSACAENYAAEGGLGGAALGAGVAAVTGGDITRDGYLDEDCFGTQGYPADPRR